MCKSQKTTQSKVGEGNDPQYVFPVQNRKTAIHQLTKRCTSSNYLPLFACLQISIPAYPMMWQNLLFTLKIKFCTLFFVGKTHLWFSFFPLLHYSCNVFCMFYVYSVYGSSMVSKDLSSALTTECLRKTRCNIFVHNSKFVRFKYSLILINKLLLNNILSVSTACVWIEEKKTC